MRGSRKMAPKRLARALLWLMELTFNALSLLVILLIALAWMLGNRLHRMLHLKR